LSELLSGLWLRFPQLFGFRTIWTRCKTKISSSLATYCGSSIKRQKILSVGQGFGQLFGQAKGTTSDRISDISLSNRERCTNVLARRLKVSRTTTETKTNASQGDSDCAHQRQLDGVRNGLLSSRAAWASAPTAPVQAGDCNRTNVTISVIAETSGVADVLSRRRNGCQRHQYYTDHQHASKRETHLLFSDITFNALR
jgi:hypothetical protein